MARPHGALIFTLLFFQVLPVIVVALPWGSPVPVTNNTITNVMPVISLDGMRVAFQANPPPLRSWQVFVTNSDGTMVRQLTNTTASNLAPSISGDGSVVVFFSDSTGNFEIYRVNSDGTGLARLTSTVRSVSSYPVISSDGSTIAFQSNRTGNMDIFSMKPDGSSLRQLTFSVAVDMHSSISGNGAMIAFQSNVTAGGQILVVGSDASQPPLRLTANSCRNRLPVISGDGRYVAFQSDCSGSWQIWRVRTDGLDLRQLTSNSFGSQSPSINYDGSLVAYEGAVDLFGDAEIFVVNVNVVDGATSVSQLTSSSPLTLNGHASVDGGGLRVVYQSDVNGVSTQLFFVQGLFSRDVGVTGISVSRDFAYSGVFAQPLTVNVFVADVGGISENFTVTLMAGSILIGTQTVLLNAGAGTVVSFSWNTQPLVRGSYALSAHASTIPGETNLVNNDLASGVVTVRLAGDVNNDCAVNFLDLGRVGAAFLKAREQVGYDAEADLNNDGVVNFIDLGVVGSNFLARCS